MKILVTGAKGFIAKNFALTLAPRSRWSALEFFRGDSDAKLFELVGAADAILHLAGENRPRDPADFKRNNADLTQTLCSAVEAAGRNIPIVAASSTQAALENDYGRSKKAGEEILQAYAARTGNTVTVLRLPGVFGKWCRPNYNSVVATFCYNIARDLPVHINDPEQELRLVYVDDVVEALLSELEQPKLGFSFSEVEPTYKTKLGALAQQIKLFKKCRENLICEDVGVGFVRALYATYVSYLPQEKFSYPLEQHGDDRGIFVEMLKTKTAGQFSFFTAYPGVTRGGHYHHTKSEKFLVIRGKALFKFRHMASGETYDLETSGAKSEIVETVPGWTHDITNIGDDELVVMLWANEVFDRERPDTFACPL